MVVEGSEELVSGLTAMAVAGIRSGAAVGVSVECGRGIRLRCTGRAPTSVSGMVGGGCLELLRYSHSRSSSSDDICILLGCRTRHCIRDI
jgi:hypothetical protein